VSYEAVCDHTTQPNLAYSPQQHEPTFQTDPPPREAPHARLINSSDKLHAIIIDWNPREPQSPAGQASSMVIHYNPIVIPDFFDNVSIAIRPWVILRESLFIVLPPIQLPDPFLVDHSLFVPKILDFDLRNELRHLPPPLLSGALNLNARVRDHSNFSQSGTNSRPITEHPQQRYNPIVPSSVVRYF